MTNPDKTKRLAPWQGMLLYLVIGVGWVFVGDALLAHAVTDTALLTTIQTWKGWAFVLLTSVLAWWLLRRVGRSEKLRYAVARELSQVVRYAPAGVARLALDGKILWANDRMGELLAMTPAHLLTLRVRDVMPLHDLDEARVQLARLVAGNIDDYVSQRVCLRGDGTTVPVLCTVTLVPEVEDVPAHLICLLQDLNEITVARAALELSEARQRLAATVVDNTIEGVVVTDAQSRILSANAAVTRLLGYTEQELLGKTPRIFKSGRHDKGFYEAMWSTVQQTGHWQGEIWNRRKNGEVFPEHMSMSVVRDPAGSITHYVCMFTDISEEKAQQRQLEYMAHNDHATGLFFMRVQFACDQHDQATLKARLAAFAEPHQMRWTLHATAAPMKTVLMVSKEGHCLNDLLFRWKSGLLPIDIRAIISNHRDFYQLAASYNVPFHHIPVTAATKPQAEAKQLEIIEAEGAELVVLARYMQVLSLDLCQALAGRAINIHHSFLPSFKGAKPYYQAHDRGVKLIGATAHYVTADLDEGPIIEQDVARADHTDMVEDLTARGRDTESQVLARAVKWHSEHRVILNGHKTVVFK